MSQDDSSIGRPDVQKIFDIMALHKKYSEDLQKLTSAKKIAKKA